MVDNLRAALSKLECRVAVLEKSPAPAVPAPAACVPYTNVSGHCLVSVLGRGFGRHWKCKFSLIFFPQGTGAPVKQEEDDYDDDDMDLFGSDEDEEAEKLKEQRLKEYAEKKAKKPAVIAKSSILLDVKPVRLSEFIALKLYSV